MPIWPEREIETRENYHPYAYQEQGDPNYSIQFYLECPWVPEAGWMSPPWQKSGETDVWQVINRVNTSTTTWTLVTFRDEEYVLSLPVSLYTWQGVTFSTQDLTADFPVLLEWSALPHHPRTEEGDIYGRTVIDIQPYQGDYYHTYTIQTKIDFVETTLWRRALPPEEPDPDFPIFPAPLVPLVMCGGGALLLAAGSLIVSASNMLQQLSQGGAAVGRKKHE